ncbi:xaa-Pro aminopeptidase 1-like [Clavelina lepadiformis]|uniref:xaa-Pro aminopeptidase 1-like n=1 Tax=Clavelina lepadiformis TaxID=159417 RepID=UPI004042B0DC
MKTKDTTNTLLKLRKVMASAIYTNHPLKAIIVPSSDAHQSEYLAECDLRRSFISGFTGSAGTAVITQKEAALWTDGRYFLQAEQELDTNWILMKMGLKDTPSIEDWLCSVLPEGSYVGVNPFLYSSSSWNKMKIALEKQGHRLLETTEDLVDQVWDNQPVAPATSLITVQENVAGKTVREKLNDLRQRMIKNGVNWLVLTALDEVAWLYNMRASDIEYNPVFFAYSVVGFNSTHLFIHQNRITDEIKNHLTNDVTVHDYDSIIPFLEQNCSSEKTWLSTNSSHAIVSAIYQIYRVTTMYSPVSMTKCVKNPTEINGMIVANNRDAVALCRYFHWMDMEVPKGNVTECSAAAKSLEFRQQEDGFVSLSFATISSSGPTGSIIHYCPNKDDDKPVKADQLYLCDSGAQYRNGTTDTTRTMHFGTPSQHEKDCFTRVLKGHIALASVVFPEGAKGFWLDALARMHLWKVGLDYRHGTGHGVGSFLNVHEGPVGCYIGNSSRVVPFAAEVDLKPGMVITDEPGYYEDGKFGIRIENALLCKKAETQHNFDGKEFYTFESLALIPIQQKMIDRSLLTEDEISWLNAYHHRCREVVGNMLKQRGYEATFEWLMKETQPF